MPTTSPAAFRAYADAKLHGFRGSYESFQRTGYRAPGVLYTPPSLSRPGYRADHLAPLPAGSAAANLKLFGVARGRGFQGSYAEFLERGYTRWSPMDSGPSDPGTRSTTAPKSAQPPAPSVQINLGVVAGALWSQMQDLEAELQRRQLPTSLRTSDQRGGAQSRSLSAAMADTAVPDRGQPLVVRPRPKSLDEAWSAGLYPTVIPALRRRIEQLGEALVEVQSLPRYEPTSRPSSRPARSLDEALFG